MGTTTTTKVAATAAGVTRATLVMNNSQAGDDRKYDVQAEVSAYAKQCESISNGKVTDRASGNPVADFSTYNPTSGQMSVNFNSASASRTEVLAAIDAFVAGAIAIAEKDLTIA